MNATNLVGLILSILVTVFLVITLLFPEKSVRAPRVNVLRLNLALDRDYPYRD